MDAIPRPRDAGQAGDDDAGRPDVGHQPPDDGGVPPQEDVGQGDTEVDVGQEGDAGPVDPVDAGGPQPPDPEACEEFVYMDEGRFMHKENPIHLKGLNFHLRMSAFAVEATDPNDMDTYTWEPFVTPYHNYSPFNYSVPRRPSHDPDWGCLCPQSCRQWLIDEQIARLAALDINSIRLVGLGVGVDDDGVLHVQDCTPVWDEGRPVPDDTYDFHCFLPLDTPERRSEHIETIRDTVRLFGEYGIRTILLAGGKGIWVNRQNHEAYLLYLEELSTALAAEPHLIGYDPMNEPPYFYKYNPDHPQGGDPPFATECEHVGSVREDFCKTAAQEVSKDWFEALTKNNPNHLVTIGLAHPDNSIPIWDPLVLYDHFTSWHIYPRGPWSAPIVNDFARRIFHAGLAACGRPCPPEAERDHLGCRVVQGPPTATGIAAEGVFAYEPVAWGPQGCPSGHRDEGVCVVGAYGLGRDEPLVFNQPHFNVVSQDGDCPEPNQLDGTGTNCLIASGPIGATGFVQTIPDEGTWFTYHYLPQALQAEPGERCVPPAQDLGGVCRLAMVPQGWSPLVTTSPYFYVKPIECGPRKPAHWGEIGFSVYPNGEDLDEFNYTNTTDGLWDYSESYWGRRRSRWQTCTAADGSEAHGTEADQVSFLFGDGHPLAEGTAVPFEGVLPMSNACGFQGLHWWVFGSVNHGSCRSNQYGLYSYWFEKLTEPPDGDERALVPRLVTGPFKEQAGYPEETSVQCLQPEGFWSTRDDAPQRGEWRLFTGTVHLEGRPDVPIPNAVVYAWITGWSQLYRVVADHEGNFVLYAPDCLVKAGASHYGYLTNNRWVSDHCGADGADLGAFALSPYPDLPDPVVDLQTPNTRRRVCLVDDRWESFPLAP